MKTKRILSVLITLVMLIGMLPTVVFAEGTTYDLWVGGVQVTSNNTTIDSTDDANITNGSATFDPITNTLTLDNFVYSGKGSLAYESVFDDIYNAAIIANENLNIVLKGTNSIDANQGDDSTIRSCYDIYAIKDVNISDADGNTSADMLTISATSYAIYSEEGNLTVKDTKINVQKAADALYSYNGSVSVDNAEISMTDVGNGFNAETTLDVLNNSVINITASSNALYLYNGTVTIENSEFISNKGFQGPPANINIKNSTVEASNLRGGNKVSITDNSTVTCGSVYETGSLDIENSELNISENGYISVGGNINITNSDVNCKGYIEAVEWISWRESVEADITITNSNVTAKTTEATAITGNVTIEGDSTVTSTGATSAFSTAPTLDGTYKVSAGDDDSAGKVDTPTADTYTTNKYVLITPAPDHTHCICGKTHASVGDHTVEDEKNFNEISTYAELVAAATNGGNCYLANDIEINSTITVTGDLTLCLNGHTLKNTDDNTRVINIDGGTLNLTDCGSTGTITGGSLTSGVSYDCFGAGVKVTDGTFNMYGGIISGNTAIYGGGVSVEYGSTFTLYDGTIRSNTAAGGGGVYSQGTFTMHGGVISENTASSGGGVFTGGTFTMHGGEISGNTANYGGGVDANYLNTIIAGGSIINNTANESPSGGIYTNQPMTLSGTPVISGNKYGDNDGYFDICKFWSEIRVTEDFAPTGSPITVSVDSTCNDYVFLETADSGVDIENYIGYFENISEFPLYKKDGKYYAGFAIIEEPTSENNYTVKVTSNNGLSSQWYKKVSVNKVLTDSDVYLASTGDGPISEYDPISQSFILHYGVFEGSISLNAGDQLIVLSQSEIEASLNGGWVTPAVERDGNTYTFTVTNTGYYYLRVAGEPGVSVKLTKNGSDFVEVEGQTALTLDTRNLEEGEYKCKLVWDRGTDDIETWSEVLTYTKPTYTVTFASNGGSAVESKICEYNQTITAPDAPTKEGFEFIAWYADDALTTKWNFETPVTENKTLYAKWVQGTVSDHEDHVNEVEVEGLNNIAKAEETDIKLVVQTEPITEGDTEQTAIKGITDAPNNFNFYDITLEKSTGGYVTDATSVIEIKLPYDFSRKTNLKVYRYHNGIPEELAQLEARATAPYADGKCFIDATNNCIYIYSLKFSTYAVAYDTVRSSSGGGVTRYTVKFDTDGGSEIASKTVTRNSKIAEPTAPEKEGYTFMGWFTDESLTVAYDFDSKVTKSITLYAKWEKVDEQESEDSDIHNCPSKAFDDLDVNAWYHEDADYVIENGIFKGVGETTFAPSDKLTRAMLVTVLYRMENEPATNRSIPFSDVNMGAYYANAISWAKQNGIVNGVTENEFAPNDYITREQIATIMMRYAVYKGMNAITLEENLHFADADEISEYAVSSMNWAVGKGLINGKSESTLAPKDNATRIEVAAILHRFVGSNK